MKSEKSIVFAFALTLLFGPLGVMYVSVAGGLILTAVAALSIFIMGPFLAAVIWLLSMILAPLQVWDQKHPTGAKQ